MFNFFTSIAHFITTIVNYVVSFFTSLIVVILCAIQALGYLVLVVSLLPSYLKVFDLAMIGVSVILFVLNKGSD